MSDEQARHYRIQGVVQGVGYRAFVWRLAGSLGLNGWVRNRQDGSVEAVLRGPSDLLDKALEQLRIGPRMSSVQHIEVSDDCADARPADVGPADAGPDGVESVRGFDIRPTV